MSKQLFLFIALAASSVNSFVISPKSDAVSTTMLSASRRDVLSTAFGGAAAAMFTFADPAQATYSAYTAREKDWEARQKSGDIKYSSARSLRKQLSELVPENDEGRSKVFCPNGPASAVTPLMENKCSDTLMAIPSVYGRTEDVVGNSIPGRANPRNMPQVGSASLTATPNIGGFPKY